MMTVSTSSALICRTSSLRVSLATFSPARRAEPFACSDRRAAARVRDVVRLRAIAYPSPLLETDEDVLDLGVELNRMHAKLAADSASLVSAERCLRVDAPAAVDAEHPGPHRPGDAQGAADVSAPDRAGKPVLVLVHQPDDFLLIRERDHRQHRTKDLFLRNPHPVLRPIENCGFEVAAAG